MRVILCGKDELKSRVIDNVEQAELINNNTELVVNKPILDIESFNVQDYSNINIQDFDSKWQELIYWLREEQETFKKISKSLAKADYELLIDYIENILLKMQELEAEDE